MQLVGALAMTMAVMAPMSAAAAAKDGTASPYMLQSAADGSCRLKGIDSSSDNMKLYASVSAKDTTLNEGCGRCIKVTKDESVSVTAFVLDVCQGCKAGEVKLSKDALTSLAIDENANGAKISYKYVNCPSSFLTGNVKACLMEGASKTYVPLQFFNSQKVIKDVEILGQKAQQQKDTFFYYVSPQANDDWYKDVQVSLTSTDDETKTGAFAFGGKSGCATTSFQFSAAKTADGTDGDGNGGTSGGGGGKGGSGALLPALLGGIGALVVVVGSIFLIRRRRAQHDAQTPDLEDPYLSPKQKFPPPPSVERPTYAMENSMHNHSTDDPSDGEAPNSPMVDFNDAVTPAAPPRNPIREQPPQPAPSQSQYQQAAYAAAVSAEPAPRPSNTSGVYSYSFSKAPSPDRSSMSAAATGNGSSRGGHSVPQFPAPVLPNSHVADADSDDDERRSSFDVDDMRQTEQIRERERLSSFTDSQSLAPYSSQSPYSTAPVTSPQSYVRATALRRNSSKSASRTDSIREPPPRFTQPATLPQASSFASDSDRDSYASDARGPVNQQQASFREPGTGYSRESLGILGYPYAKKTGSGRNSSSSITELNL